MSQNLIAIILAAGIAAFVYSKVGKRLGYGNTRRVWAVVGIVFVAAYLVFLVTFTWVVHFSPGL